MAKGCNEWQCLDARLIGFDRILHTCVPGGTKTDYCGAAQF